MRVEPAPKYADREGHRKKQTEKITRIVALIVAFLSTFFFFIKLLFL